MYHDIITIRESTLEVDLPMGVDAFIEGSGNSQSGASSAPRIFAKSLTFGGQSVSSKLEGYDGGSKLDEKTEAAIVFSHIRLPLFPNVNDSVCLIGEMGFEAAQDLMTKYTTLESASQLEIELSEFNDKQLILERAAGAQFTNGISCDGSIKIVVNKGYDNVYVQIDNHGKTARAQVQIRGYYAATCSTTLHVQYRKKDNKQSYKLEGK
ncbi:hypothetical protein [Cysteiniphilum litorale]|uniref:hypothetical protein n=1 Tax=Cysteiniphilum litorale TaxID=2056700 RepID=UPI003F882E55